MEFAIGVDLSMLKFIQDHGVEYKENGFVEAPLTIFANHGVNVVRLRLFVDPDGNDGQVNDLQYTLALAKQVKEAGLQLLLDFHYSDKWADPQGQSIPARWTKLSETDLAATLCTYSRDVIRSFDAQGCLPDLVQIGNEITNGMLWPIGAVSNENGWSGLSRLLKAGIDGAREGGYLGKIMIHVDQGGNKGICQWFYDKIHEHEVPFDVIGLSYYPFWHGTLDDLAANLEHLAVRYGKPIVVVETGYDWRGEYGSLPEYPSSPDGQRRFLASVFQIVGNTPQSLGAGVFWWAPEWIAGAQWNGPDWSPVWESRALFDTAGNAMAALDAFDEPREPLRGRRSRTISLL